MLDISTSPTQRQIHPSPSGPARAVWGMGTPCGGFDVCTVPFISPTQRQIRPSPSGPTWAVWGIRTPHQATQLGNWQETYAAQWRDR